MKSLREYIGERMDNTVGTTYKIAGGATGPNANVMYKKTMNGWDVSKDSGKTWQAATNDHPSPMFNIQDIETELEFGFIEPA